MVISQARFDQGMTEELERLGVMFPAYPSATTDTRDRGIDASHETGQPDEATSPRTSGNTSTHGPTRRTSGDTAAEEDFLSHAIRILTGSK